jgi:arsenite methyltransferase
VISNGVINIAPDKAAVFSAAARALRPGGRLAIADIVTTVQLPEGVTCDAALWAACIGGAMQRDRYLDTSQRPDSRSTAFVIILSTSSSPTALRVR